MFDRILTSSRFVIVLAVLGSFLASLTMLIYGGIRTFFVIAVAIRNGVAEKGGKAITVSFIELIDVFLVGTIFYIVALGLYELFIDENLKLPSWLVIHDLDDLKGKLISSVIVILAVYFLGAVVNWDGKTSLLSLSASITLCILALTFFLYFGKKKDE